MKTGEGAQEEKKERIAHKKKLMESYAIEVKIESKTEPALLP